MADTELRKWLRKHPHPVIIVGYTGDEDEEPKRIKVGVSRSKWRDAEAACESYAKLEALDGEGALLRVLEFEGGEATSGSTSKTQTASDPETVRLLKVAELLADAADKAAARHEAAYKLGFETLSSIITVMSGRLTQLERVYQQMILNQAQPAPAEGDDMVKAVIALAPALLGAKQPPPNNGKPDAK